MDTGAFYLVLQELHKVENCSRKSQQVLEWSEWLCPRWERTAFYFREEMKLRDRRGRGHGPSLTTNHNLQKSQNLSTHGCLWKPVNELTFWVGVWGEKREVPGKRGAGRNRRPRGPGKWVQNVPEAWTGSSSQEDELPGSRQLSWGCSLVSCPRTTIPERHTGLTHIGMLPTLGLLSPSTHKVLHQRSVSAPLLLLWNSCQEFNLNTWEGGNECTQWLWTRPSACVTLG